MKISADRALTNLGNAIRKKGQPICQQTDPEAWFPESGAHGGEYRKAMDMCKPCPVKTECAIYAIVAGEGYGIWGGLNTRTRQAVRLGYISLQDAMEGKRLPARIRLD